MLTGTFKMTSTTGMVNRATWCLRKSQISINYQSTSNDKPHDISSLTLQSDVQITSKLQASLEITITYVYSLRETHSD